MDNLQAYREAITQIPAARRADPAAFRSALVQRALADGGNFEPDRFSLLSSSRQLFIVAADHPARGALAASGNPRAMADRRDLLLRLCEALSHPEVDGVLATADILEELAYVISQVRAPQRIRLEEKLLVASMNRGGLAGASFELDDRYTAYDAAGAKAAQLDMLKLLLRIDLQDAGSLQTLENTAKAVNAAAAARIPVMLEPFMSSRAADGRVVNDLSTDAVIKSVAISSGLGNTSAYSWLKLPVVDDMAAVVQASTLPVLLLGGDGSSLDELYRKWRQALALPGVEGLVVGRSLLYPPGGMSVTQAIQGAAELLAR